MAFLNSQTPCIAPISSGCAYVRILVSAYLAPQGNWSESTRVACRRNEYSILDQHDVDLPLFSGFGFERRV